MRALSCRVVSRCVVLCCVVLFPLLFLCCVVLCRVVYTIRHDTRQRDTTQHNATRQENKTRNNTCCFCVVLYCVVLCRVVLWCCIVLCSPQHHTTQRNTTQHNTTQHEIPVFLCCHVVEREGGGYFSSPRWGYVNTTQEGGGVLCVGGLCEYANHPMEHDLFFWEKGGATYITPFEGWWTVCSTRTPFWSCWCYHKRGGCIALPGKIVVNNVGR